MRELMDIEEFNITGGLTCQCGVISTIGVGCDAYCRILSLGYLRLNQKYKTLMTRDDITSAMACNQWCCNELKARWFKYGQENYNYCTSGEIGTKIDFPAIL